MFCSARRSILMISRKNLARSVPLRHELPVIPITTTINYIHAAHWEVIRLLYSIRIDILDDASVELMTLR